MRAVKITRKSNVKKSSRRKNVADQKSRRRKNVADQKPKNDETDISHPKRQTRVGFVREQLKTLTRYMNN